MMSERSITDVLSKVRQADLQTTFDIVTDVVL